MTREEAIEYIAQSVKSDVDMAKVADAIKALEQEQKWIPVSEKLPKDGKIVNTRKEIFFKDIEIESEVLNADSD